MLHIILYTKSPLPMVLCSFSSCLYSGFSSQTCDVLLYNVRSCSLSLLCGFSWQICQWASVSCCHSYFRVILKLLSSNCIAFLFFLAPNWIFSLTSLSLRSLMHTMCCSRIAENYSVHYHQNTRWNRWHSSRTPERPTKVTSQEL